MRKTRDLFNKIGNTKGTYPAKMRTIKDRNGEEVMWPKLDSKWMVGWFWGWVEQSMGGHETAGTR